MIFLLDSNQDYDTAVADFGVSKSAVGQLITPLTRFSNRRRDKFAIDNGAYAGFESKPFVTLLKREFSNRKRCLFVACPDVVCNARRTLEVFRHWQPKLSQDNWPVALVAQDGIEDLDIPWHLIKAIFIGGSDKFKLGQAAVDLIRAGQAIDKWVHVGRVNSPERFDKFEDLEVDSIDGSGISQYTHMRRNLKSPTLYSKEASPC